MRIEFDPTNPTEAAAVRAMLTAMGPTEVRLTDDAAATIQEYLSHVGEATRASIAESAKMSQAAIGTLRVGPLVEKLDEYSVQREAIPTGVTDDGWQTVEAGPATDSQGEPHDPRIHSTPPKLNADGTWRAKRGVTADQIAAVRAEREHDANLSATPEELIEQAQPLEVATEAPPAPPASEPAVSAPPAPPAPTGQSGSPLAPAVTPTAPAETAPTPPSAPVAPSNPSFLDVMKAITAAQKDGKIDTAKVKELCAAVGAGESTMGLNGPDNGDKRVAFMALLAEVAS